MLNKLKYYNFFPKKLANSKKSRNFAMCFSWY